MDGIDEKVGESPEPTPVKIDEVDQVPNFAMPVERQQSVKSVHKEELSGEEKEMMEQVNKADEE